MYIFEVVGAGVAADGGGPPMSVVATAGPQGDAGGLTPRVVRSPGPLPNDVRQWAPPPSPQERLRILWESAREDAKMVAQAARALHPEHIELREPFIDIHPDALMRRVMTYLPRGEFGSAYVGSTSGPAWRWQGGFCWRCERNARAPRLLPTHMVGHRIRWRRMVVVASFSDQRTAIAEEKILNILKGRDDLENVASDARGLAIRPQPGYSFIYVCTD